MEFIFSYYRKRVKMRTIVLTMILASVLSAAAQDDFSAWDNSDKWLKASDAMLNPTNNRQLAGKPGNGVLVNGEEGNRPSLVTKRRDYRDVEVHVEFMIAKGSNSGVIFHGNYEIQIRDTHGVRKPGPGDCGGIYPQAGAEPTYHHIGGGAAPRINVAKPHGQWQTLDIIFQSPRFDESGKKTAHAEFVKVVHNGVVIQENVEVPYACGTNWDRQQYPKGPIIIQGDYGPIAIRNIRVRDYEPGAEHVPVPPEGFTALFNGKDLTGWRVYPKVKAMWSIEKGVLKSHGLLEEWGADLVTEKEYRDYVLMADFRMPTDSDSGIHFRNLAPVMLGKMGDAEQFNIRSRAGMGQLESFHSMPENMKLSDEQFPKVKYIDPEIGVWHTVKLTVAGQNITAELDGEVILDSFVYPEGILSTKPNPIRFQKHRFTEGDEPGERNPCPIEFRNIFIRELEPSESSGPGEPGESNSELVKLLARIDTQSLPSGYYPQKHQDYVDRRMAGLSEAQRAQVGKLWQEKQRIDPDMPNRGQSFVKIMEYVAGNLKEIAGNEEKREK